MPNRSNQKGVIDSRSPEFITIDPVTGQIDSKGATAISVSNVGSIKNLGTFATHAALDSGAPASSNPGGIALLGSASQYVAAWSNGSFYSAMSPGPRQVVAQTFAEIQTLATAAVTNQVHTVINLIPGVTYSGPSGVTLTLDSAWVELEMNYAVLDFSAWGTTNGTAIYVVGNNSGLHDYTYYRRWKRVIRNGMVVNDPAKYIGSDNGPDLIVFDVTGLTAGQTATSTNRVYIERMVFVGGRRNVMWGSGSYFTKFYGCEFARAYQCFGCTAAPVDFAEQIEFDTCLAAENGVVWGPVPSGAGQIMNWRGGSIDYNLQICNMTNGTRVYLHDKPHIEWRYGSNTGETNEPFKISGADGYFGGTCSMIYTGTNDPKYVTIAASDNGTTQWNFELFSATNLARKSNRKSLDAFHRNIGAVNAQISVKLWAPQTRTADFPAMITVSESSGSYGMIRGGINSPFAGVAHMMSAVGTANAVTEFTASDGTVNRKPVSAEAGGGSQPMLKLQNPTPGAGAVPVAGASNVGNPTFSAITATAGTVEPGLYTVTFTSATAFTVTKPNGSTLASGTVGTAFSSGGVGFTITAGGTAAVAGDKFTFKAGARYYISFPKYYQGTKASWAFFVNTFAMTSGSATIKERRNGPAAVFDGVNVTFAYPSDGANYHGNTVTLTQANSANGDDWNRYDARDTASSSTTATSTMLTQVRHDMTFLDIVEIDMTGATGPLYLSFIGCGPIGK